MTEIIPAILEQRFEGMKEKLSRVVSLVPLVQIDVCDGKFVPSQSWPYVETRNRSGTKQHGTDTEHDKDFQAILSEQKGLPFWDKLDFEFDLMVKEPEGVVEKYIKAGASRIVLHVESTAQLSEIIHEWQHAVTLSLAANIDTPLEAFDDYAHHVKDFQLMGIANIGMQGQAFDERVLPRVRALKKRHPEHTITVDGGVSPKTAPQLIDAGAARLVVGSALFESNNIVDTIGKLKSL